MTRWKTIPRSPSPIYQTAVVLAAALIATAYLNSARLGFNTPAWYTQEVLGGHRRTAHFDLYYDPGALSEKQVDRLAEDHEWHYHRLEKRLGAAPPAGERIASYLYPDEETKARLTGARETSVAPVWLDRPQVHLLQSAYAESFGHELVHTFSREFGLPVLNASRSVGLVEGLAVAFEPPHGRPAPADQVSASLFLGENDDEGKPSGLAEGVAARLSPLSFWTGRAAVGYTTMGAFVRFLAQRYGTDKLRAVYAQANFEDVYGTSARALADEWETALLKRRTVARAAGALAERRFSRPSLFEAACPHHVPPFVRAYRAGRSALAAGDTSAARSRFRRALRRKPAFEAARVSAARLLLARDSRRAAHRALRLLRAAPPADSGREHDAAAAAPGSAARVVRADAQALAGNACGGDRLAGRAVGRS
ncbi:MAG: hypothetical protein BRD40_01945 [Bacteroidetes bacterium QS_1_65_9]|nr:MAG: hypothetical protein BRD40_01945 [Bacteroidetes bacterium QS_1_65_9]